MTKQRVWTLKSIISHSHKRLLYGFETPTFDNVTSCPIVYNIYVANIVLYDDLPIANQLASLGGNILQKV